MEGKLLRPRVALLGAPSRGAGLDDRFWSGALAVQLVHDASLVHDDLIDGAQTRRGRPTVVASRGIGAAVVVGDHLLTCAYRCATLTKSAQFIEMFADAVERTVAGEMAQGRARGRRLTMDEYREIVLGKTGRLFGCAMASGAAIGGLDSGPGHQDVRYLRALGERLGVFYQMVDDLLDFCPTAHTGKQPFQDYRNGVWTWPLSELDGAELERPVDDVAIEMLSATRASAPPLARALQRLRQEAARLEADLLKIQPGGAALARMVHRWALTAADAIDRPHAVATERASSSGRASVPRVAAPSPEARVVGRARRIEAAGDLGRYFAQNSASFRFASRFFPAEPRERVTEVYAFCRFTDDLVDDRPGTDPAVLAAELDAWSSLARRVHGGEATGIALLDRPMSQMAAARVPFHYAQELIEGVRMDLVPRTYTSMEELRVYTYRVASVVGGWLTELFGTNDPWLLARAFSLGHAMQLTNILRDVGEDLRAERLYIPLDRLRRHGLAPEDLRHMARTGSVNSAYRGMIEELLRDAEREYDFAFDGIPGLQPFFRRPVAVAARVYEGIHRSIRNNDYDNLEKRARTGTITKVLLGIRALSDLRRTPAWQSEPALPPPWLPLATAERVES
jgi:phytoene synthase